MASTFLPIPNRPLRRGLSFCCGVYERDDGLRIFTPWEIVEDGRKAGRLFELYHNHMRRRAGFRPIAYIKLKRSK